MLDGVNGIEQLCPNCGLCCDSTLFADVELRAGDDARRLAAELIQRKSSAPPKA